MVVNFYVTQIEDILRNVFLRCVYTMEVNGFNVVWFLTFLKISSTEEKVRQVWKDMIFFCFDLCYLLNVQRIEFYHSGSGVCVFIEACVEVQES